MEYYFRLGGSNVYIGRFETKEFHSEIKFHDRYIGSVWELVTDLKAEKPEQFEHECVSLDWRSFRRLIPEDATVECPHCKNVEMLETHGTSECPGGMHVCVLSLPVYVCENGHAFFWLGRFVDTDDKPIRKLMGNYEWDV